MDQLPLVSVVVPTHRRPAEVRRAVAAIVGQDYDGPIEVVVVHDGEAADPTLASDATGRTVRAVENTRVRGLTGVRNTGLAHATGELVGWCDDDDLWAVGKLSAQVRALVAAPDAPGVGGGFRWVTPDGTAYAQVPPRPVVVREDLFLQGNAPLGLHSSTVVVRRSAYDAIGGYDETLPQSRAEDYEFFLRLTGLGPVPVVLDPAVDVAWDMSTDFSADRRRTMARAMQQIAERHPEIVASRVAEARLRRRVAMNLSLAGDHGPARVEAWRAVRCEPTDPRALLVLACATAHVSVGRPFAVIARLKARRGRGPLTSTEHLS